MHILMMMMMKRMKMVLGGYERGREGERERGRETERDRERRCIMCVWTVFCVHPCVWKLIILLK